MYVPVGREVELLIRTQDVTHSFYVRELRLKQDAVPGMVIHMHFNADGAGPIRNCLRRALRPGPLPHAQLPECGFPGRIR